MSAFFSGSLNPFWPHFWLLGGAIIGGFAVAAGIVLEHPKWSLTNVLVVGGVAIEAVCTLLLFGFDEGISNSQQEKIIALETRLADRVLTDAQVASIANKMKSYAGHEYSLRAVWTDREPSALAGRVEKILDMAGWKPRDRAVDHNVTVLGGAAGITIAFDPTTDETVKKAGAALGAALNDEGIYSVAGQIGQSEEWRNTISIFVGVKPQ